MSQRAKAFLWIFNGRLELLLPAVRRIVEQIAPILGVLPVDEKSPLIRQKMLLDFTIGDKEATLASY